ncbi:hypothetical protein CW304_27885 [Bacillus sp. UFRGS-B20]|nr:hypothetical protein CW304_27885 [Bacillus sp. UFRGS-B20]
MQLSLHKPIKDSKCICVVHMNPPEWVKCYHTEYQHAIPQYVLIQFPGSNPPLSATSKWTPSVI